MALHRPRCDATVHADAADVPADWARCTSCGEGFKASAAFEAFGQAGLIETAAPSPHVIGVDPLPGGGVEVFLPRRGLHGKAIFCFVFGAFWNVIVLVVIVGFGMGVAKGETPPLLMLFFVPFVLVGVGMPLWGCWLAWGTTRLRLDRYEAAIVRQLFGWRRRKTFRLEDVEPFERRAGGPNPRGP